MEQLKKRQLLTKQSRKIIVLKDDTVRLRLDLLKDENTYLNMMYKVIEGPLEQYINTGPKL
jgi:hypothetical protein